MSLQVLGWVTEKIQVASDESYRDPTNLKGKLQKQQAFDAEVVSNRKRVDVVLAVSKQLSLSLFLLIFVFLPPADTCSRGSFEI